MVFGLWFFLRDMPRGTVMIYECLLPLHQFIATVEKLQYSRLSHYVSSSKIAGI